MYEVEHQTYLSEETPSLVAARMDEHRLYIFWVVQMVVVDIALKTLLRECIMMQLN